MRGRGKVRDNIYHVKVPFYTLKNTVKKCDNIMYKFIYIWIESVYLFLITEKYHLNCSRNSFKEGGISKLNDLVFFG